MNYKRRNKRGHVRRKDFGGHHANTLKMFYEEKNQIKKTFLRFVQAVENGDLWALEDERP